MAFAALDIQWLSQIRLGIEKSLPNGSTISQIDDRGVVLAHHPDPDTWVGRSLASTHLFDAVRSKENGIVETEWPDGQNRLYAFSRLFSALGNRNAYMLVGVPKNSLFLAADRLLAHNLILLAGVTLIAILATWFGGDLFILHQVRAMVGAATKLARGDLKSRTGIGQGTGNWIYWPEPSTTWRQPWSEGKYSTSKRRRSSGTREGSCGIFPPTWSLSGRKKEPGSHGKYAMSWGKG